MATKEPGISSPASSSVDILQCVRCGLAWVRDTEAIRNHCPFCFVKFGSEGEIVIMGTKVSVRSVIEFGSRYGLLDPEVRRGLAELNLGLCPHGYLTEIICSECMS